MAGRSSVVPGLVQEPAPGRDRHPPARRAGHAAAGPPDQAPGLSGATGGGEVTRSGVVTSWSPGYFDPSDHHQQRPRDAPARDPHGPPGPRRLGARPGTSTSATSPPSTARHGRAVPPARPGPGPPGPPGGRDLVAAGDARPRVGRASRRLRRVPPALRLRRLRPGAAARAGRRCCAPGGRRSSTPSTTCATRTTPTARAHDAQLDVLVPGRRRADHPDPRRRRRDRAALGPRGAGRAAPARRRPAHDGAAAARARGAAPGRRSGSGCTSRACAPAWTRWRSCRPWSRRSRALPDAVLQVNGHRDVLDDDGARRDDALASYLRDARPRGSPRAARARLPLRRRPVGLPRLARRLGAALPLRHPLRLARGLPRPRHHGRGADAAATTPSRARC